MEDKLLQNFFYINTRLLKINTFVLSDRAFHVLFPVFPLCAVFASVFELYQGNFIFFYTPILIVGLLVSFLVMTVSIYYFRGVEVFKEFKRHRSNQNLRTGNSKSNVSIKKPHEDISTLVTTKKELINKYFSGIRRIGLVNDDVTISDFENLIENCFIESKNNFSFDLEINANEVNYFVRELMQPLLERINDKNNPLFNKIIPLFKYKKTKGYFTMKVSTSSNLKRASCTKEQKALYDELKKM